jgi:lipopolysaccharide transport system permease protein
MSSADALAATATTPARVISPRSGWIGLDLPELWSYRELCYFLVWRDVKVRYKQTAFGVLWALIQPLGLMAVFTLVLGQMSGVATSRVPYPIFALVGLVPWTLFSQCLIGSADSLVSASNLIQKVYFPRLLLPIAAVASYLLDFAIAALLLVFVIMYSGVGITPNALWAVPLTLLITLASLAVGVCLAAINVRYRDVRYAVPFLVQLWLFASPVAYSLDLVPKEWLGLFELNPMTGAIEGFRWALLGQGAPAPLMAIAVSIGVTALVLMLGLAYFRRMELAFADVI